MSALLRKQQGTTRVKVLNFSWSFPFNQCLQAGHILADQQSTVIDFPGFEGAKPESSDELQAESQPEWTPYAGQTTVLSNLGRVGSPGRCMKTGWWKIGLPIQVRGL